MTPEERQMLADLARKFAQTPAAQPDPEAEEFIRHNIGCRPDALYLMTQTVLIQNMALEQARRQQQAPPAAGGFLGAQQPQQPQPQPSLFGGFGGGGGSSFLRSAATTAAGVAAGALAFEGIRSLFSGGGGLFGHHEASGFMGGLGNFEASPAEQDSTEEDDGSTYEEASDDSSDDSGSDDSGSDDNFA